MSFVHSKNTVIILDGKDISAPTNASELDRTAATSDLTGYGLDDQVFGYGLGSGTASIGGNYDSSLTVGPRAVIEPIVQQQRIVTLVRRPEGTGSGKPQQSVNVLVTSYKETNPVADYIAWTASLQLSGPITDTVQP